MGSAQEILFIHPRYKCFKFSLTTWLKIFRLEDLEARHFVAVRVANYVSTT